MKKTCKRNDLNAAEELSIIVTVSQNQPDRTELYLVYRKWKATIWRKDDSLTNTEKIKMTANVKDEPFKKAKLLISALQNMERIFSLPTTKKGGFPFF